MTRADREYQASQFLAYQRKRGQSLDDCFEAWARSKQFSRRDYIGIKTIVVDELSSGGPVVSRELGIGA